jgi:hypothetical protein
VDLLQRVACVEYATPDMRQLRAIPEISLYQARMSQRLIVDLRQRGRKEQAR